MFNFWEQFLDNGSARESLRRATMTREDCHSAIIASLQLFSSLMSHKSLNFKGFQKTSLERERFAKRPATVLIIDESLFSRTSDFRRTFKWRKLGPHYPPSNDQEIEHYGSGGLDRHSIG
ncbi:hypothetical protein TNCV_4488581 [Trichonephila clavipes]|nr:hypothetical protein TNCV_4488581 [Trichonephila clavipes]